MAIFEADVYYDLPEHEYMTIEAVDADEAEFELREQLRIDNSELKNIEIQNIKELHV